METTRTRKNWLRSSTLHIFLALVLGVGLGGLLPSDSHPVAAELFHSLSKGFIALIKGLIIPLLLSTIIGGIAKAGDLKAVGRLGGKALLYFEVVTTLALGIGLFAANWLRPGAGLPLGAADPSQAHATGKSGWEIALHMLPSNVFEHAAKGDILPIVMFATLFGISLTRVGVSAQPLLGLFEAVAQTMFKYTDMVMRLTPLGVFGAMAYNVSHMAAGQVLNHEVVKGWPAVYGLLQNYARLVGSLYLSLLLLFVLVFVPVMLACGLHVRRFLRAIRDPALTAFSTASSEAALPQLLENMVSFGVPERVASFVIPTGYAFNLDGSTLYLVLASMTIAQAASIDLTLSQQLAMALTFMLTSKGVAGVPRATLVIIAGTCQSFGLPGEAGVALLLAVDELMDMARTAINVVGNGLACAVVARWEGVIESRALRTAPSAACGPVAALSSSAPDTPIPG
jgi:Na+/H+-dicarboxylate symporter